MTLGTGIFLSTILLLLALAAWQVSIHAKWKIVGKVAAGSVALCIVLGICIYAWTYIAGLAARPSVVGPLGGAQLGTSPTDVKLALGKPDVEGNATLEGAHTRIDYSYSQ